MAGEYRDPPAGEPDETTPRLNWGGGFVRGFELGVARTADALRMRLLAPDFQAAGWTVDDVEAFVSSVVLEADKSRPSR